MKFSRANQFLCRKKMNWMVLMAFVLSLNLFHEAGCETNCTATTSFTCRNGTCISTAAICNGKRDCSEVEDELECEIYQCGLVGSHDQGRKVRIVGGNEARKHSWPWFVLITKNSRTPEESLREENFKGGGSVINKHWVLTAAHVLNEDKSIGDKTKDYVIFIALWKKNSPKSPHSIAKYVDHPNFNEYAYLDNDIALIKIGSKLDKEMNPISHIFNGLNFGRNIQAVCLPGYSTRNSITSCITEDEIGVVIGFGHIKKNNKPRYEFMPSRQLKEAKLMIKDRMRCRNEFDDIHDRTKEQYNLNFTENMLCFGPADKKTIDGACKGDSGGPLMKKVSHPGGGTTRWVQIGIVSYGYGCGTGTGFYTDVSKYTSWIGETIAEKEPEHPITPEPVPSSDLIGQKEDVTNDGTKTVCSRLVQFLIIWLSVLNLS